MGGAVPRQNSTGGRYVELGSLGRRGKNNTEDTEGTEKAEIRGGLHGYFPSALRTMGATSLPRISMARSIF
jgi:hypothetical protein